MSEFTVSSTVFAEFWTFASADLYELITEVLFYGILLVLVAFAVTLLSRKRQAVGGSVLGAATGVMLIFATAQLLARFVATFEAFRVFSLAVQGQRAPESDIARRAMSKYIDVNFAEDVLLVTNNLFTDSLLIYRCFLIWGRNKYIIIGPGLLLLLSAALSYVAAVQGDYPTAGGPTVDLRIGFALSVFTNLLLVGLTAGRIWYTRRRAHGFLEKSVAARYNTAIMMVLESGGILCAWVVAYVVVRSISPPTVWRVFRGGMAQMLNIAPTLIVVRVGLGHTIQETTGTWTANGSSVESLTSKPESLRSTQV
ncbi:hypothetical protein B0H15DRAFT_122640 [Mycena belliarum]|uniref:Uncharacterized protein n=1 Tax=Mycena belliarum TaxID=1033014 RepID=A0AAD6TP40_9AGAR|nr:hypothetical protein B0H15DRAFT_122640 [Mycena belliae]